MSLFTEERELRALEWDNPNVLKRLQNWRSIGAARGGSSAWWDILYPVTGKFSGATNAKMLAGELRLTFRSIKEKKDPRYENQQIVAFVLDPEGALWLVEPTEGLTPVSSCWERMK